MSGNEHVTTREFGAAIDRLDSRFDKMESRFDLRFDTLDAKLDGHTERIVTIESTAYRGKTKSAGWAAAIAAVAITILEGFRAFLR